MISLLLLGGCGPVHFLGGRSFSPQSIETNLVSGISDISEIKGIMGEPYGKGRALMPFHETPRTVWTYFFAQGNMNLGSGDAEENRKYLFVFIDDDTYEGYMWFESHLQNVD